MPPGRGDVLKDARRRVEPRINQTSCFRSNSRRRQIRTWTEAEHVINYLVVHDGSQAHDAHMDVVLLARGLGLLVHLVSQSGAYSVKKDNKWEDT